MSGIGDQRPKRKAARKSVAAQSARADQYKQAAKDRATASTTKSGSTTKGGQTPSDQRSRRQGNSSAATGGERGKPARGKDRRTGQSDRPQRLHRGSQPRGGHVKGSGVRTRRLAASVLARIEREEGWATPILDEALTAGDLDQRDKAFVSNLVFSTIRMQGTLDAVLNETLNTPIDKLDPQVRATLRIATWELLAGNAPDHAVVKSHVDAIAKASKSRHFIGFTNGVLRGVIRQRDQFDWLGTKVFPNDRAMAFALGYPYWIVELARDRFGDGTQQLLDKSNTPAPIILRAIGNPEALVEDLVAADINAKVHPKVPGAVVVHTRGRGADLQVVQEGRAVVQDAGSQAVVLAAVDGVSAGASVVDLCAAPGGKAIALAQHDLDVQANDRSEFRMKRLREQAARFGLTMRITVDDGKLFEPADGPVDLVLLDAPCSGLGVMRRRPEIRWHRLPDDITTLAALQGELFDAAVTMVKPGGKLVYSVCTWTEAETDGVVRAALERHPNLTVQPVPIEAGTTTEFGTQLTPHQDESDGMYIAVFAVG